MSRVVYFLNVFRKFSWFGDEPSWSRYLGWSVGLSQHKFQNKIIGPD